MKNLKSLVTACCLSLVLNSAYAVNDELNMSVAQTLLEEGNAKDGYAFLLADFDNTSINPLEYRLLGLLAKNSGRPREAKKYFKQVVKLSTDENLIGEAKLELAQIAYQLGDGGVAKNYLSDVKSQKPPAKVNDNIDAFLKVIEAEGAPKNYQISGSLGYLYDSNANAGPTVDSVLIFGLPFTLSTDAKETSDNASQINLGFNHNKGLTDDMSLQSNISVNRTDYEDLSNLDSVVVSGSTGLSFRVSDEVVVSIPLVASWVKVGHEDSYYSYSYGIAPQLRYQTGPKLSFNLGATLRRQKYKSSSDRGSESYSIFPSLVYQINSQSYGVLGFTAGTSHSGLAHYSSDTLGANVRYSYAFTSGLQASINASYTNTDYKGKEAAYAKVRYDKTASIGFSILYPIQNIGADLVLSASYTNNDSNLPIYRYDRNQVSLSFIKKF